MSIPKRYGADVFHTSTTYHLADASYAWMADDRRVLISSDESGIFNVYTLDTETGEVEALTSSKTDSSFAICAFPADNRVLFRADNGGNELNHIHVREESGDVRDLTPGDKVRAMFAGWSSNSEYFYIASNARDPKSFDLYRYRAIDYASDLVFQNDDSLAIGAIGDDRYIALVKSHTNSNADIFLLDRESNTPAPRLITPHDSDIEYSVFGFTRDNRQLIISSNEHGEFREAHTFDLETSEVTPLISAPWDVLFVSESISGRYRLSGINADARTEISIKDIRQGREVSLEGLPRGEVSGVRFSRAEDRIAVLVSTDTSPADVYIATLGESGQARRLTRALNDAIDESALVSAAIVRYPSYDGLSIPCVLYRPIGADQDAPCPALVYVHGGPGGQSRCGFAPVIQHIVNHGYAVLAANNRGSSGYGKTFFHMDDRRHGEVDLDDIVEAKHYLASLDWVDEDRIGIIGGSYGGYMVGAALAFRPGVFRLGIDIFGVMNWVRTLKEIPPWWGQMRDSLYDLMGDPTTDEERLTRISPLFHASNINVPLLVVQGANDPRVLKVESDEIVDAVRANGVPVEYILFDDEGHGFSKRANRIAASDAYVNFLRNHLE